MKRKEYKYNATWKDDEKSEIFKIVKALLIRFAIFQVDLYQNTIYLAGNFVKIFVKLISN